MVRSPLAALTGLLAAVLLPLGLLSVWLDTVLTDTHAYVDTVAPLADDDAVRSAAVRALDREALTLLARSGVPMPPGSDELVRLVVRQVVDGPAFRTVWVEANRTAHEQLVAVLEGRSDVALDERGRVTIDLAGVLVAIGETLADRGVPGADRVTGVQVTLAVLDADRVAKVRRSYDALHALGFWVPVLWAASVLLTLLLARRRAAASAKLAIASLLAVGGLALALVLARDAVTAGTTDPDVALAVWDVVVARLWHQTAAVAAALVVIAGVAACLAALLGRSRARPVGDRPGP